MEYLDELKHNIRKITDELRSEGEDSRYRKLADKLFQYHQSLYEGLDFDNITMKSNSYTELTSTEKYFLKALLGQVAKEIYFPEYWTFTYAINYRELIPKLIESGYTIIEYPSDDLSFLTGMKLKEALKSLSLKVSGKKQEQIERLINSGRVVEALNNIGEYKKRFVLTALGHETVDDLPASATKNLELEDKCLDLIKQGKFNDAYKEICRSECLKPIPRGIGTVDMDDYWKSESRTGLSDSHQRRLTKYWNENISLQMSGDDRDFTMEIKSCVILGQMLGTSYKETFKILLRIAPYICISETDIASMSEKL